MANEKTLQKTVMAVLEELQSLQTQEMNSLIRKAMDLMNKSKVKENASARGDLRVAEPILKALADDLISPALVKGMSLQEPMAVDMN